MNCELTTNNNHSEILHRSNIHLYIVVPVFNRVQTILNFLGHLISQTYRFFTVVVVDDCSSDGTSEEIEANFSNKLNLIVLKTQGDAWWGGGVFIGLEKVMEMADDCDCALIMNDDISFENDLLEKFVQNHQRMPDCVLSALPVAGDRIIAPGSNFVFWPLAMTRRPLNGFVWPSNELPEFVKVDFNHCRACLYPLKILRVIGNIAYKDLPHYHGDGEFSYRATKNGFGSFVATRIVIFLDKNACASSSVTGGFLGIVRSLFVTRSINNIFDRWAFSKLCAPRIWRVPYFFSHVMKLLMRSFFIYMQALIQNHCNSVKH